MQLLSEKDRVGQRLSRSFYIRADVAQVSKDLLGKFLVTQIEGEQTAGMIVETEAYRGPDDQACHAANDRRTARTEIMYALGGHVYVYLIYGIHRMFNVVSGPENAAHAVLIRAIQPVEPTALMLRRRNFDQVKTQLSAGPGVLTKALGIELVHNGLDLTDEKSPIWIEDRGIQIPARSLSIGTRVGIAYAGEDAYRPWRFSIQNNPWVSRGKGLLRASKQ